MAAAKYGAAVLASVALTSGCGPQPATRAPVPAQATLPVRPAPISTPACLADASTSLVLGYSAPVNCTSTNLECRAECLDGDAGACMARAYVIERDAAMASEAALLFERACQLGLALGCTNYAATIWGRGGTKEDLACAQRLFAKSCSAKEKFGCGMVGRMMYESAKTPDDYARAREQLEQACAAVEGFPCRVLAKYFEEGKLGNYEPGKIFELLAHACDGGDRDACGSPATASETFH